MGSLPRSRWGVLREKEAIAFGQIVKLRPNSVPPLFSLFPFRSKSLPRRWPVFAVGVGSMAFTCVARFGIVVPLSYFFIRS